MEINKIDDETIEIVTETRKQRTKREIEEEKEMFVREKENAEDKIKEIDDLLLHFK